MVHVEKVFENLLFYEVVHSFLLLVFVAAAIFLVLTLYRKRRLKMNVLRRNGIPGPQPHLLYGNLYDHHSMANVLWDNQLTERYGPIAGYYLGAKPFILISDPDLVQRIQIEDNRLFLDRPRRVPGGINPDPKRCLMLGNLNVPEWQRLRKMLGPAFSSLNLKQMVPEITALINTLLAKVESAASLNQPINLYERFQCLTLDIIGSTSFGLSTNIQERPVDDPLLKAVTAEFAKTTNSMLINFYLCFPEFSWILNHLRRNIERMRSALGRSESAALWDLGLSALVQRQQQLQAPKADLLHLLVNPKHGLSADQIVANSVLYFEASYETLSSSLGFIVHLLVNHQDVQDKVRMELQEFVDSHDTLDSFAVLSELTYLDAVIKEGLRLFPPQTTFIGRSPDVDFSYTKDGHTYTFPKGIHLLIGLTQLHYSAQLWPNPTAFDPDRFLVQDGPALHKVCWQAFGGGRRICIGQKFANLVLKLTLAKLLFQFQLLRCEKTEEKVAIQYKVATMTPSNGSWALPRIVHP